MQFQRKNDLDMHFTSLEEAVKEYWRVSRCWNDHRRAVREEMSFAKAMKILRAVRNTAHTKSNPKVLRSAQKLIDAIVSKSENVGETIEIPTGTS